MISHWEFCCFMTDYDLIDIVPGRCQSAIICSIFPAQVIKI